MIQDTMRRLNGEESAHGDGLKWYTTDKLLRFASDCPLWMITGERRIGKTHYFLHLALELWNEYGYQTCWIRNRKVEYDSDQFRSSFMNAPLRFGWITEDWEVKEDGLHDPEGRLVITFASISTFSNMRGNEWPDLHFCFLDEMEDEARRIIKFPHTAIMSLCKTMLSGKTDCMICMASNRISATNSYFVGFKVYPDPRYDVTAYHDKGIAIETCRKGHYHSSIPPDDPFQKVFKAGRYGDYADDSEDDLTTLIRPVPKGAKPTGATFLIDSTYYRCWQKDQLFYFSEYKGQVKESDWVTTPNVAECGEGIELVWPFQLKDLKTMMNAGAVRYADANTMMVIINMVYQIAV